VCDSNKFKDDNLSKCVCGFEPIVIDDAMSIKIECEKCSNCTEEYLYGANSYGHVYRSIINEWNDKAKKIL